MPLMFRQILVLICLFIPVQLTAQPAGTLPVRRYGTEQGLGSEVVSALVQDHAGLIWAGTEDEVSYFDGKRFTPFTGSLPPGFVRTLTVDRDGALWVATDDGLARISQGRSRIFGEAEGIPRGAVQDVARDADGRLWILTSQGIKVQQPNHGFSAPSPWPDQESPTHLFADPSLGGAWAITSNGIWRWREEGWTKLAPPSLSSGEILLDIAVDGDQNLWIRASSSLWRQSNNDSSSWIGSRIAGGYSHISKLSRDTQGWIWVDTAEGLWRLRGDRRVRHGHALDDARGGMVDQEGGIWFRTDKGILRVLGQTQWRTYGPQEGLPYDTTWPMIRDHQGKLWVAMDSGLYVSEGERFQRVVKGRFLTLALAKRDTLWASGSPGGTVHQINTRTLVDRAIRIEALPVARITAGLAIDGEDHLWVADEQGIVVRGTAAGLGWNWEVMPMSGAIPRDVKCLLALPGGGVLMLYGQSAALWRHGAWKILPDVLDATPYIAASGPEGQVVIAYKNRPVLTLHAMKGDALARTAILELAAPRSKLVCYSVGFGSRGRIWVGTTRGLGFLDGQDARSFRLLGSEDRIISAECDEAALLVEGDRVWVGTPSGLMSHDALLTPPPHNLRSPLILSARAGSQVLDPASPAPELPRDHNELEVRFMVPSYQVQDALIYAAKLSGVDADWVYLDTPALRYAGLQAGAHELQLRGQTRHGDLGPVTSFQFSVRPAWWERWWVRLLGLLAFAGAIILLVKLRQARLEQRNRELVEEVARQTSIPVAASKAKSAFLANMSHELRTPLNAILLYSEILQGDLKDPALDGLKQDVDKIQSAGRHLLGLIDDILDISKIEAGYIRLDLRELVTNTFFQDLDATVRPLVERNGNRFEVDLRDLPENFQTDPTRLKQILVNLLSNSAKFTSGGVVQLRAWVEGQQLIMAVQDNGIGMTHEQQSRVFDEFVQADDSTTRKYGGTGLGLTLVKKFMDLLGGELSLESAPGVGTTFTLTFTLTVPVENQSAESPIKTDKAGAGGS